MSEALGESQEYSSQEVDYLREQCRSNLYFLCKGVLGFKDTDQGAHGDYCKFIQDEAKLRRLGLLPRGHLKSTLNTVGDSIRLALLDPENARILIACETSTLAELFLNQIKSHFERNEMLRTLFPELVPPRFQGAGVNWSSTSASIVRSSTSGTPTWSTVGVGGAVTGNHFTRIKCDDLIGFEALRSPAAMDRAKAWLNYIEPLLVNSRTDIIDFTGTRWSRNDLYSKVMDTYGDRLGVFTRRAIEVGADGQPYIIFPALHTWEEYEGLQRTNPVLWRAQYENDPVSSGARDLPVDQLRFFKFNNDLEVIFRGSDGKEKRWHMDQLDKVLTADPNSGSLNAPDQAAISVQGMTPEGDLIQLDSWGGRVTPTDFVDQIYIKARRWRVRLVGIEKAGQQNTDFYFRRKAQTENYHVRVEELRPAGRKKEDRIRSALEPLIRSASYYVLLGQDGLRKQLDEFPDTELIDELDAAAYGPDLLRKPDNVTVESQKSRADLMKKLLARRASRTGY